MMASRSAPRLLQLRRLLTPRTAQNKPSLLAAFSASTGGDAADGNLFSSPMLRSTLDLQRVARAFFSSRPSALDEGHNPASVDYRSVMSEDEFHRLADVTILDLLEKFEEYGDTVQVDGYEVDYGNHVLTLKLGTLGTYVINKQTPNRQIWLSSPVSGPARFDWDITTKTWVYRRTKANLLHLMEEEVGNLCGKTLSL